MKLLDPKLPADVLILRPWTHWTKVVVPARFLYRRPYVVWLDTYHYETQASLREHLYHEVRYGWLLRNANLVIGETPRVTEVARQKLKNVPVIHVPMSLDVGTIRSIEADWMRRGEQPERLQTILFVGRISPEKRPHLLVELFSELAHQFPDWRLKIVGPVAGQDGLPDSQYEAKFRYSLTASTARGRIEWLPGVYGEDLYKEYAQSSIYALPSDREGVPSGVIEAMYFGNAVIATKVGVVDWQLDYGRAGLLVDAHNREGIKEGLRRLMADSELRAELADCGYRRVMDAFNWENHIGNLYEEIQRLVPPEKRGA
jgi:glycosyltransferase involved in cell wall biosynthesis